MTAFLHDIPPRQLRVGALIYPAFMCLVGGGVLFVLITYVVPDIMQVYTKMEKALPLPTQLLIGCGILIKNYWWLLLLGGLLYGACVQVHLAALLLLGIAWACSNNRRRISWRLVGGCGTTSWPLPKSNCGARLFG